MKKLKYVAILLVAAMALAFLLSFTASAGTTFTYEVGNLELECSLNGDMAMVSVLKVLNGTEDSPVEVTFPSVVTIENKDYTVTAIWQSSLDSGEAIIPQEYQQCVSKVNVPEGINYLGGNLYSWRYETEYTNSDIIYESKRYDIPDTAKVLSNIPAYVSNNYVDGALYVNECLVRVDPAYTGNFTVKDGTICVLAGAFEGCSSIGNVSIPASVEFIGMRAFANSSVKSVNLPAGMADHSADLANYTFYNCTSLETVTIDKTIGDIGLGCFQNCSSLTGFDFSKVTGYIYSVSFGRAFDPEANVTVDLTNAKIVGYGQFAGSGIVGVKLQKGKIVTEMFRNCDKLTNIVWNKNIDTVGCRAFENCTSYAADFGADEAIAIEFLDYRSFANTAITEITLPATLTSVAGGVFAENKQLATLNWKSPDLGSSYFSVFSFLNDCSNSGPSPYMVTCSADLMSDDYCKKPEKNGNTFITTLNFYVPFIEGNPSAFAELPYLETVNFKCEIETIRSGMFKFSPSLKTVTFAYPEKLLNIQSEAFEFCPSLESFPFEQMTSLTTIGSNAFMLGSGFFSAKAVNEMTGDIAGYGLKKADLSKTKLKTIQYAAFQNQFHIKSLITPETLEEAYSSVFVGTASLENVTMNGPVSAFQHYEESGWNYSLSASFYVTPSDTYYSYKYYDGCEPYPISCVNDTIKNFTALNAGPGTEYCELFVGFAGLENVTLGKMEVLPNNIFTNCVNLKTVNLPDTVKFGADGCSSGLKMFMNCANLTAVNAPKLTTINCEAFMYCGIKKITADMMPALTAIPNNCFMYCNDLASVEFTSVKTVGTNAFMNDNALKTVKLPALAEVQYRGFAKCGLEQVVVSDGVEYGKNAFQECRKLKNIIIENGRTEMSAFMFDSCEGIEKIALAPTLKTINWGAFKITDLYDSPEKPAAKISVLVPASVVLIEDDAFANREVDLILAGAPYISTKYEDNETSIYGSYSATTIGENSRIFYMTDAGKASAEEYAARDFDEDSAPDILKAVESLLIEITDAPEEVVAGEDLDTSAMTVKFLGETLTDDLYALDYDKSDVTLGNREVTLTLNDADETYYLVLKSSMSGASMLGEECSGTPGTVSEDKPQSASFDVNVKAKKYTLTFEVNEGSEIDAEDIEEGTEVDLSGYVTTKAGFEFKGWFDNSDFEGEPVTSLTMDEDKTVYAKWEKIHVHSYDKEVESDESFKSAADCENAAVYYKSCECGEISDTETFEVGEPLGHSFTTKPSAQKATDATCTEPETYYVQCDRCEEIDTEKTVEVGEPLDHDWGEWVSVNDTEHHRFCNNDNSHEETENHNIVNHECTVCDYVVPSYTVTFEMNGFGTQVEEQTVFEGDKAAKPADPSEEGYTFEGWYADEDCTEEFDFDAEIAENAIVYAKWTKNAAPITPEMGEKAGMTFWFVLMIAGIFALLAMVVCTKRKKAE